MITLDSRIYYSTHKSILAMRTKRLFRQTHIKIMKGLFTLMIFLSALTLKAQTPTNFSGKWQFDKLNSIPDQIEPDYDGTIIMEITQNATTISFDEIYIHTGRDDWKTATETYKLDGKEQITNSSIGTNKKSAKWSPDKKVLTITNLDKQKLKGVLQDFLVTDTYQLSDDGKTLTIERYRNNPVTGETNAKKVYLKK
jgi:hypothetical protein